MADPETRGMVKVTVSLEVMEGPYGESWTLKDCEKQAERLATEKVQRLIDSARDMKFGQVLSTEIRLIRERT